MDDHLGVAKRDPADLVATTLLLIDDFGDNLHRVITRLVAPQAWSAPLMADQAGRLTDLSSGNGLPGGVRGTFWVWVTCPARMSSIGWMAWLGVVSARHVKTSMWASWCSGQVQTVMCDSARTSTQVAPWG
jgi:hypothetical protein